MEINIPPGIIDYAALAASITEPYKNVPLTVVNDHVIRLSIMTEPFYWHRHPNSDEPYKRTIDVSDNALMLDR